MDWHYQDPRTGDRRGPVAQEAIAAKLRAGELDGDALVWREGLASWQLASLTPEFASIARPTLATAMPAGETIGYYTPRGDTPARVRENLRKYAPPTGPVGDWPLNDAHVAQLAEAARLRKRVLGGAAVARVLALLACLGMLGGFMGLASMATSPGRGGAASWAMLGVLGFYLAIAAGAWAAAIAIRHFRAWASLVLAILASLGCGAMIVGSAFALANAPPRDQLSMTITLGVLALVSALIVFVLWRAWAATPKYLNTPVWCQEALAVADRGR